MAASLAAPLKIVPVTVNLSSFREYQDCSAVEQLDLSLVAPETSKIGGGGRINSHLAEGTLNL